MHLLNKLSLAKKLCLILLLPLALMAYFVEQLFEADFGDVKQAAATETLPAYFEAMSELVHQLQLERGMSAGYLTSEGTRFGSELTPQRAEVDQAVIAFQSVHSELKDTTKAQFAVAAQSLADNLKGLPRIRQRVTELAMTREDLLASYTSLIVENIDLIASVKKETSSGAIAATVSGFHSLLNMKEAAGVERALLTTVFTEKAISPTVFEQLLSLANSQRIHENMFYTSVTAEQNTELKAAVTSSQYTTALAQRDLALAFARGQDGVSLDTTGMTVLTDQSAKIDALKKVETKLNADLREIAQEIKGSAQNDLILVAIKGTMALLFTLAIGYFMVRSMVSSASQAVSAAQRLGEGNLSQSISSDATDEIGQFLNSLSDTQDRLVKVIGDIQTASSEVDNGAREISEGNHDLSERTQLQAQNLEEINKKVQMLSSMVCHSTQQQLDGDKLAMQALDLTTNCSEMVQQLYLSMQEIRDSSKNIMTITSVIDEIAFQTNLLSLNAAVEAARAGEQGKGFAVVASEVRQLAQRSSHAASEINELIDNSVQKVNKGGDLAETARNALEEVQDSVRSVTDVMKELSQNSQTQASGIGEITEMVSTIEDSTQRNAAMVEEVAAASETLGQGASDLNKVIRYFSV